MTQRTWGQIACAECGIAVEVVHPRQRYCGSLCKNRTAARKQLKGSCATCAKPIQIGKTSRPPGEAQCLECRRSQIVHGSVKQGYRKGCRCDECRQAHTDACREQRARRKTRDGLAQPRRKNRTYKRPLQSPQPCIDCSTPTRSRAVEPRCKPCSVRSRRGVHLPADQRTAIYERDGWVCGFCGEAVDPSLSGASQFGPTLDHLVPRSLGGSDDPSNLRLVHRWCNTVRGANTAMTIDEMVA